jgi:hypothetical protein
MYCSIPELINVAITVLGIFKYVTEESYPRLLSMYLAEWGNKMDVNCTPENE